jgi:5-methylcytosine-specific restriction endonuclease McrA
MKLCPECREEKPRSAFTTDKRKFDGLFYKCKACVNKARNERAKDGRYKKHHVSAKAPDQWKLYLSQWHADNPDKITQYCNSRRARLHEAFEEQVDRRVVWGRDEGHCRIKMVCNGDFVPFEAMELDHIIPLVRGGKHAYHNVQTGCRPCNRAKSDKVVTLS